MSDTVEKWGIFELTLNGPSEGNPFLDVNLSARFRFKNKEIFTEGFYDGNGIYKIRFMPDSEGEWSFITSSNCSKLDGIEGKFICTPSSPNNHGPVRVVNTYHFAYEDGTPYYPIGTTCYAWIHQGEELERQTLETLKNSPFNKLRMCIFPKHYEFNKNEPIYYPFEGSLEKGWDFTRFNVEFFRHLEQRLKELQELNIEADLILFHPYDRWGFSNMGQEADDRYLKYVIARLSAFRNVWWSLANEYDIMKTKTLLDWERFAKIIVENDPYQHLRSIHNCRFIYDFTKPWVTHCSIQRIDWYKTAENIDVWREFYKKPVIIDECAYEGNIHRGWGSITGEEMVRRFWEGYVRGGYVGHGETYVHPEDILWWSKGGRLYGKSPERISFLRKIIEEGPPYGINPIKMDTDIPCGGIENKYYVFYLGFNQPAYRIFKMPFGIKFKVDIIDTWNMTIEEVPGVYEGTFRIDLPSRPYMAVRMRAIGG